MLVCMIVYVLCMISCVGLMLLLCCLCVSDDYVCVCAISYDVHMIVDAVLYVVLCLCV